MNLFEEKLLLIESRLQVIVEGTAGRLFPGGNLSDLLAIRLAGAVRSGLTLMPDGRLAAPDHLALLVCPEEYELLSSERWLREVEAALRSIGPEQGISFPEGNFLQVESRPQLAPGELLVAPCEVVDGISQTTDVVAAVDEDHPIPAGAFLIVNGVEIFPLDRLVVNMGRRPDNTLVIEDGRVSRTHAQLRYVHGQFVVFDLDSRGGTFVNGGRVSQRVLHAGDVISLAGVPVVFGQDLPGLGETQELSLF